MPYVHRQDNVIVGVFSEPSIDANEYISLDNPELLAYLAGDNEQDQVAVDFVQSDLEMARVVEDLIEVLLEKNVVAITDFPVPVIEKLKKRQGIRGQISLFEKIFGQESWD